MNTMYKMSEYIEAADTFGHALQTGQLAPVFQQFGLPEETTSAAVSGGKWREEEERYSYPCYFRYSGIREEVD